MAANARFISRAYLGGEKTELTDHWAVLQADSPGQCQITVKTEPKKLQQMALDIGWGDSVYRVFSGYVERYQPSANGWFTAFCREYSAILEANFSVQLRHPTMQQVIDELATQTGLTFLLPNASYVNKPIACFYSDTSGIAMLKAIGRSFGINDFVWFQQGNGSVYVGSYADSLWHGKAATIPVNKMTDHQAAKAATVPAAPMVRPHATINGERLRLVEFKGTDMVLEW